MSSDEQESKRSFYFMVNNDKNDVLMFCYTKWLLLINGFRGVRGWLGHYVL